MSGTDAAGRAADAHRHRWGEPDFVARAPGRVNLIGEHTDYNDGFVLPMAIPFDTAVAVSWADPTDPIRIHSEGFGDAVLDPGPGGGDDVGGAPWDTSDWAIHIRGTQHLLAEAGVAPPPWRATIATDVPTGASLSSSASVEVATAVAILRLAGSHWTPTEIALLGQRVENEIVGLPSGIMDQLISASAVAGHASLIDCRTLETHTQKLPEGVVVAVMDTQTRRQLVDSAFAERRATCQRVADLLGVEALRDADESDLDRLPTDLAVERHRARHVVTENQRTLEAAEAMARGDATTLGRLMRASHASLRDDYEVSSQTLDQITAIAEQSPGCLGARMTGGGFAGCAVALVERERVEPFIESVTAGYRRAQDLEATIWICDAAAGGSVIAPPT